MFRQRYLNKFNIIAKNINKTSVMEDHPYKKEGSKIIYMDFEISSLHSGDERE